MSEWHDLTDLRIMLRAMAHEDRLRILRHLAGQGEVNVTDLVSALIISQPLVSWHLRLLRRANLVRTRRQGRAVYCSLDLERFATCQLALAALIAPGGASAAAPGAPPAPAATTSPASAAGRSPPATDRTTRDGAPPNRRPPPRTAARTGPRARAGPADPPDG